MVVAKVDGMRVGIISAAVLGDVNNNELINIRSRECLLAPLGRRGWWKMILSRDPYPTSSSSAIDSEGVAD